MLKVFGASGLAAQSGSRQESAVGDTGRSCGSLSSAFASGSTVPPQCSGLQAAAALRVPGDCEGFLVSFLVLLVAEERDASETCSRSHSGKGLAMQGRWEASILLSSSSCLPPTPPFSFHHLLLFLQFFFFFFLLLTLHPFLVGFHKQAA